MTTCKHADSGCNYPEGECLGVCMANPDAEAEARRYIQSLAEDHKAIRKWKIGMMRTHLRCTNCVDGLDGEPDGFGGYIGGSCNECLGTGWMPHPIPAKAARSASHD